MLESVKVSQITFENALEKIYENSGRLEASFASKLVATVNPNFPVVDRFVLNNTGLKLPYYSSPERKKKIVKVYEKLRTYFIDFLETDTGKILVERFRETYPLQNVTPTKMVDLVLWQTR